MNLLERYFQLFPVPPLPETHRKKLATNIDFLPNYPKTYMQDSRRMTNGVFALPVLERDNVVPAGLILSLLDHWAKEEFEWRGLGTGNPKPVPIAHDVDTGEELRNDVGDPIPVTVWDEQHPEMQRYVIGSALAAKLGNKALAKKLILQARDLVDLMLLHPVCSAPQDDRPNQREAGWCGEALVWYWLATQDHRCLLAIKNIFTRLRRMSDQIAQEDPKDQWGNPIPVVTDNWNAGKDHWFCGVSYWMTSRIEVLCWLLVRLGLDSDDVKVVRLRAVECAKYAQLRGVKATGIEEKSVDDHDPNGAIGINKKDGYGVMDVFAWTARVLSTSDLPGFRAQWLGRDGVRAADPNFTLKTALGWHNVQAALVASVKYGYR